MDAREPRNPSRSTVHVAPDVLKRIGHIAGHLSYAQRGQQVAALVSGAVEIVAARPELFAAALAVGSAANNAGAAPVGREWGQHVAAVLTAAPVALPEGWTIEPGPDGGWDLYAPDERLVAHAVGGTVRTHRSPACPSTDLIAAIAAFVAAAGGAR